jgi:RNA polymerase sigma factor (sigma-70 family)
MRPHVIPPVNYFARLGRSDREARAALRELYDELSPRLFASLATRRVNPADAAEIVQDTFLKIWTSRTALPADANPHAYVWCMARNAWIDKYRMRKVRDAEIASGVDVEEMMGNVEAPDNGVFMSCLEKAFDAFRSAQPERAHAIELVAVQGLDHRELATALSRSAGAAREFLSQARRAFSHVYEELCGEPT